jgi:hypothetical protein
MKVATIDGVNALLIVIAAGAAFLFPFEVFLFSYAFFGPLHYLTEISWLEKRNFFLTNKNFIWFLVLIGCFLFMMQLGFVSFTSSLTVAALLVAAAFSTTLFYIRPWTTYQRILIIALILTTLLCTYFLSSWAIFFAILLPTIIHVSIFTLLFMWQGAQRSTSVFGYMNVALYFVATSVLLLVTIQGNAYSLSTYITEAYRSFEGVNLEIMNLLNIGSENIQWSIYESAAGLSIMRFIAFAYTYHYLNWFSKIHVINWHKVPPKKMYFIVLMWLSAIALYLINYQIGLFVLFFLSLMHVLLEFPLNHQSILGIVSGLKLKGKA